MNRRKIAQELVRLAKELTAKGKTFGDYNEGSGYQMWEIARDYKRDFEGLYQHMGSSNAEHHGYGQKADVRNDGDHEVEVFDSGLSEDGRDIIWEASTKMEPTGISVAVTVTIWVGGYEDAESEVFPPEARIDKAIHWIEKKAQDLYDNHRRRGHLKEARDMTAGSLRRGDKLYVNLKMSSRMDISEGTWKVERITGNSVIIKYAGPESEFDGGDRKARFLLEDIEPLVS